MKFPLPEDLDKFYPSQEQFIKDCTDHIKKGGVGIFASPTGTGKTISLLSSILSFPHKVYYSSKTYDQLNQSIKELKRFKETIHSNEAILLGSRGVYCVNKSINKNDLDKINDSCNKLIKKNGCEFYSKTVFKEIPGIICIEDMHKQAGCPYFISKSQNKRITFLPYQMIFSKQSRLSYNIDLKNTIIVIDEAHNIFDTVVQMNTVVINHFLVKKILNFLSKKEICSFRDFLIKILKKFVIFFKERKQNEETKKLKENENNLQNGFKKASNFNVKDLSRNIKECCMSVDQFNLLLGLENYNFFSLEDDAKEYSSNLEERSEFYQIFAFLVLLTFSDEGGRVFISEDSVKFVPLDPKIYFEELKEAKAVILAGGTMEPQKYYERVFGKVSYFSYDSVCKNLKLVLIPQSTKKFDLVLNLEKRTFFIKEVCEMISGLIAQCKKGNVVIFVPSSSFLNLVKETSIQSEKKIFWDDKQFFKSQNSVLISIMGGRLSEGINFSDDMCRLLLIISIPFPSLSLELREKEKYFGNEYSTTQAMRIVNQTIGRAVRHKNDYAVAILIDFRYKFLKKYFSEWMKDIFYEKNYEEAKIFIDDFYKKFD